MPEKYLRYDSQSRRKFIYNLSAAVGAGIVLSIPMVAGASAAETYTVKQIIDAFMQQVPGAPFAGTVDTLKTGSADMVVKGIVTSMFATIDVVRKAIELDANFIIVHEPTFYNHTDATEWLKTDDVYQYKRDLLDRHQIAVWRNHDTIHTLKPDGVTKNVLQQLGWQRFQGHDLPNILTMPPTSLKDLISQAKEKLHIDQVRYIGDPAQSCTRVLFIPGAAGGTRQIQAIEKVKPDVLICGEISEWETAEYVRDARAKGDNLSLVLLGHIASEEPGSEFMLGWLKEHFPAVRSTHINCGNSLSFM